MKRNTLTIRASLLLSLFLISTSHAIPVQQECDGEKKVCCLVADQYGVPPMWVNAASCPRGTVDDATCILQYGCKAITPSKP